MLKFRFNQHGKYANEGLELSSGPNGPNVLGALIVNLEHPRYGPISER